MQIHRQQLLHQRKLMRLWVQLMHLGYKLLIMSTIVKILLDLLPLE